MAVAPGWFVMLIGTRGCAQEEGKHLPREEAQPLSKPWLPGQGRSSRAVPRAAGKPGPGVQEAQLVLASYVEDKGCLPTIRKNKVSPPCICSS